jgi:hypothetical protein
MVACWTQGKAQYPQNEETMRKTIMRSRIVAVLSFALIFMTAAVQSTFAQDVRYNFDSSADFSSYKTYKWVDNPNAEKLSDLVDRQLKAAVDAELATKGLTKVDSDDANLYIAYQVALRQEKQYTSYNSGWGYGPGWRGYGGTGMTTGQTTTIQVGALDLDIYDAAKKDLVWEGTATKTIDSNAKPDKQQQNLTKAVAKLLKNYPPPLKK